MKNGSAVGTPLYWPLQILRSESYTSKCDIWAVGTIFYEMLHGHTPWSARTQFELIHQIGNKPLSIDKDLSDESKNFIEMALQLEESNRPSWDEVFLHSIFKDHFQQYALENKHFEDKLKRVMGELRFEVNSHNIDLNKLIEKLGFHNKKQLNFEEFTHFCHTIHPKITKSQIKFFCQKMDTDGDGKVSMEQLETEMKKHRISFNKNSETKVNQTGSYKVNTDQVSENLEIRIQRCFIKLHEILSTKQLTLMATFQAYDTDRNGELKISEFERIIKRLDTSFSEEEIIAAFNMLDKSCSKTITFQELNEYYSSVNGLG